MSETEKLSEFEKLKQRYEEVVLKSIKTFVDTNDENFVEHKKPHFHYFRLACMVVEYANEGYVNVDKIDQIIAPAMIDDYRIYNNALLDFNHGYESRSDGLDNVASIIHILANVDHTKFPRLKNGLINHILTEKSQPITNLLFVENPWEVQRKFEIDRLKRQYKGTSILSEELYAEIFGEPIVKLTRTPIREEDCGLPFIN